MNNARFQALREQMERHVSDARSTVEAADREGRRLTEEEARYAWRKIASAENARDELAQAQAVTERVRKAAPSTGPAPMLNMFKAAGWSPGKRVSVPFSDLFRAKTPTFSGDLEDLSPTRREGVGLGFQRDYFYQVFTQEPLSEGTTTIQTLRQSSRTLAMPEGSGDTGMIRPLDSTEQKPETSSERELVHVEPSMVASVQSGIPNFILNSNGFRTMVETDLRLSYEAALDVLVKDGVDALSPQTTTAGNNLLEALRFALLDMRQDGYTGNAVILSLEDAAALDLFTVSLGEQYVFNGVASRFGLSFTQSKALSSGEVYLIDTGAVGRLAVGPVTLASFEEAAGLTNTSLVRLEGAACFVPERDQAVRLVSVAGS